MADSLPKQITRILLADNDLLFATVIRDQLNQANYEVSLAQDGVEALERVRKLKPDCVILDLVMPKINGERVCRLLKNDPELKKIPIVVLSGVTRESLPEDFLNIPDAILTKGPMASTFENLLKFLKHVSNPERKLAAGGDFQESDLSLKRRKIVAELFSRARYQEIILDHITNGMIVTDVEQRILVFNRAAESLLNKQELQVLGHPLAEILPDIFGPGGLIQAKPHSRKIHFGQKYIHVSLSLMSEEKEDLGWLVILSDLTEEWLREKEKEQFRKNLEETVQQRTREIEEANQKLKALNLDLAQANQMKSDFVANMSHELRSPLNDILGFTQLLEGRTYGEITPRQEEAIHLVADSAQVLLHFINAILDFSRLEAGEEKLQPETMEVKELLEDIFKSGKHLLRGRPVKFQLDVASDIPPIFCDRGKLRQVITNLVHNAIKFTKRGSIKLRARVLLPEQKVEVIIEDTGIGIDNKDHTLIFDPFRQADGSSTREFGGTGLGLAITKKLLDLLQGEISLKSSLNLGSTFRVTLPIGHPEAHVQT